MTKEQKRAYDKVYRETHAEKLKANKAAYYEANKVRLKAKANAYYKVNKLKAKAQRKIYYEANKSTINTQTKTYYKANKLKIKGQRNVYYDVNRSKIRIQHKRYYDENKSTIKEKNKLCCKLHPEKIREYIHKRRALKLKTHFEPINDKRVFMRDGWICQICHFKVNKNLRRPDVMSASLDHIIPLSKGGTHTYSNVQLAHFTCNMKKHNNVLVQGEQLRMF